MEVIADNRADSTLDQIAAEELAENDALREQVAADEQAQAAEAFEALAAGWRQAVVTAGDIITSMMPEAKPVWTDERMTNLGAALARADEVYGWGGAGSLFSHPLVGVAVAGFPLAVGTAQVVRAKSEAHKLAKLRESKAAQTAAPVIGDVSPAGAAAEVAVGDDMPAAVAAKIKPTPLNPGGQPAFGS
ncbi:hypothetical protein WS97_12105 [Burkholderia territorii]|uniref:hypothetical protein n=1 Tax=Burkholderia territorii TaxID=1503055 RepID=UPI00075A964A|nr:hypothetical protein [Burkholderia territorii]KVL36387.1 hypothetical protein WS97_12105 [Burkholderia territorii]